MYDLRLSKLSPGRQFQTYHADQYQQGEEHTQQRSRIAKEHKAKHKGTYRPDACPNYVGSANGNNPLRQIEEKATQRHADDCKRNIQPEMFGMQVGQLEAQRPADFKQCSQYEIKPRQGDWD